MGEINEYGQPVDTDEALEELFGRVDADIERHQRVHKKSKEQRMVQHTPTPWTVDEYRNILGQHPDRDEDTVICEVWDTHEGLEGDSPEAEANAAHIVKCVNAHEKLRKVCEMLSQYHCECTDHRKRPEDAPPLLEFMDILDAASDALEAAAGVPAEKGGGDVAADA